MKTLMIAAVALTCSSCIHRTEMRDYQIACPAGTVFVMTDYAKDGTGRTVVCRKAA